MNRAKQVLLWIVGPFLALAGFAFFLWSKLQESRAETKHAKFEAELGKFLEELGAAKERADDLEKQADLDRDDFQRALDEHRKG